MSQEMPKFDPQEDGVNIVFPERTVEMKGHVGITLSRASSSTIATTSG